MSALVRGAPEPQMAVLSTLSTEDLIPAGHPSRVAVDIVVGELNPLNGHLRPSTLESRSGQR